MTRVLVVWEDERHVDLSDLVDARLAARRPGLHLGGDSILHIPAKGRNNFAPFVEATWPNLCRGAGASQAEAYDHVLCVVDGDAVAETVATIPGIPSDVTAIDAWHQGAEVEWEKFIRAAATTATPIGTIHGVVLRWCKESVILAGFDEPDSMKYLRIDAGKAGVIAYLAACAPGASSLQTAGTFTNQFRQPWECLRRLQEASGRPAGLRKNDSRYDAALRQLAQNDRYRDILCTRVPDIDRLVNRLESLVRPGTTPAQ